MTETNEHNTGTKKTVSTVAMGDVKRLEKSLNAMNTWYILALYLLLLLGSGLTVWAAYANDIFAPYTYMYVIAFVTLIAGVTFRYFAITRIGSFVIGIFALVYMLSWVWILFDQAYTGVMTSGNPKTLIHPKEFYIGAVVLALASLLFMAQPIVQFRRKRLLKRVTKHIESADAKNGDETHQEQDTNAQKTDTGKEPEKTDG